MVRCHGCGFPLPAVDGPQPDGLDASAECWELYGQLSAYTLTLGESEFVHQYVVDAYAAQHAGGRTKPITITFALIGLCLACDYGFTGRQVQQAHMQLGRHKRQWPTFQSPPNLGRVTVVDVLGVSPGARRVAAIRTWAAGVWEAWRPEHDRVRRLVRLWLPNAVPHAGRGRP